MSSEVDTLDLEVQLKSGEALGIIPNENLIIAHVQPETVAYGKFFVGDRVLAVDGVQISNLKNLAEALDKSQAKITISRDGNKDVNVMHNKGYTYLTGRLIWTNGGPKLGLGLKHFQNHVLVSRSEKNSLVEHILNVGDRIIDISGYPVTHKDVASDLLIKVLQVFGEAVLSIERPITLETKELANAVLSAPNTLTSSMKMSSDARKIAKQIATKLALKETPKASILKAGTMGRVTISDEVQSHLIGTDYGLY